MISFFNNSTISTLFHAHQKIKNEHRAVCICLFIKTAREFLCWWIPTHRGLLEEVTSLSRGTGGCLLHSHQGAVPPSSIRILSSLPRQVGQAPLSRGCRQAATGQGDGGSRPGVPPRGQAEHGQEEPWTHQRTRLRPRTPHSWLRICTGSHGVEGAGQEVVWRATPSTLHTRTPRSREGS